MSIQSRLQKLEAIAMPKPSFGEAFAARVRMRKPLHLAVFNHLGGEGLGLFRELFDDEDRLSGTWTHITWSWLTDSEITRAEHDLRFSSRSPRDLNAEPDDPIERAQDIDVIKRWYLAQGESEEEAEAYTLQPLLNAILSTPKEECIAFFRAELAQPQENVEQQ